MDVGWMSDGCRMASDLMDDALGMSGYNPDAMDKVIQGEQVNGWTPFFINSHTRVGVCILKKECPPIRPVYPTAAFSIY